MDNLGTVLILILAIFAVYMLFSDDKPSIPQPVASVLKESKHSSQENISDNASVNIPIEGFDNDIQQQCSCGCLNCKCNPLNCKCGQVMNASDQYAVAIQGKEMIYDCGCGCSQKEKPNVSITNPEFLNEWANFRNHSFQNSNNINHDTVDLIHQMYVDNNMMPSRKDKGKTIAEVYDKLTNKQDFMDCIELPNMYDQPLIGVNPHDPNENIFNNNI